MPADTLINITSQHLPTTWKFACIWMWLFTFSFFLLWSSERICLYFLCDGKKPQDSFFKGTLEFYFLALKERNLSNQRLNQVLSGLALKVSAPHSGWRLPNQSPYKQTAPAAKNTGKERNQSSSRPMISQSLLNVRVLWGGFKNPHGQATPQTN